MAAHSSIEWTDQTWNPVTGCTKISPGCDNCYAERFAKRLQAMGNRGYENGFDLTIHRNRLEEPLHWRKPRFVFVNSMSDLFHEEIPTSFIEEVFAVMRKANNHIFQILTKRARRLARAAPHLTWSSNIWIGVSVENKDYTWRMNYLRGVPAKVHFVSFEPLIGPIPKLSLRAIDWVIVGGESGPNARPILPEWVRKIRDHCEKVDVPFFFKQWGGRTSKSKGRVLDGRKWNEMPGNHFELAQQS